MNRRQRKEYKRRLLLGTVILALVAAAVALGARALEKNRRSAWDGGYSVRISEVMTDNISCPDEQGLLCDWVEIENTSSKPFDLGGYYLSDEAGEGKYRFPNGSMVPAHGYLLVWCDPMAEGEYAPFGLKKEGGESVCLLNPNRVVMDQALTVACSAGQSLIRGEGGALTPTDTPTPGYPNDENGVRAWQAVVESRSAGTLELSEIMSSNTLYAAPDGGYYDWIEVRNPTDRAVALAGYKLSDREEKTKFSFPANRALGAGEVLVIWCRAGAEGEYMAPFALSSGGGETVVLTSPAGTVADRVALPALEKNTAYVKTASGWEITDKPTPGYPNGEAGYAELLRSTGYEDVPVEISEVMYANKGFCTDADGAFSDWLELHNTGAASLELAGWYLSDSEEEITKWQIPALTLAPGEHVRLWASGKNKQGSDGLHTSFALSEGETLTLSAPTGTRLCSVTLTGAAEGSSLALAENDAYISCDFPTPGEPNTAAGYEALCAADTRTSPLLLWEIAVYDENHDDWVELKNVSANPVELSDYTVTDKESEPERMHLPAATVNPGESVVVELKGFGLNAQREWVYLFDSAGKPCDWAFLRHIPLGGSYGRQEGQNGFFYFTQQTPGAANGQGWRSVAAAPTADRAPGLYRDEDTLLVTLYGEDVYYTTDGSTPTRDATPCTGPIQVTGAAVIRAASLPAGQLGSETVTLSYFLGETSTLPVVSLVTDRPNLFGPQGIYDHHEQAWEHDWERPASLSLFEEDGSFTIDCGIQIHGRTSRRVSEKRSFKLNFRGRYGGTLHYDVFGDGAVTDFSSLLLRGSTEGTYTSYMRDELFASLAMELTEVPAQNYRYVTLYINGEYWGIYAIREHHSKDYFASHYGVEADSVVMQNGEFRNPGPFADLLTYAENHDLSTAEAWQYIQEHVDVPEMIDWLILECWGGDRDVYENVRFYISPEHENGKLIYGLVDMDLCMFGHETFSVGFENWPQLHAIIPRALLSNREFRDMFLTRLGELLQGGLSDEAVLTRIEELRAIVEPEAARDLQRWGWGADTFSGQVQILRTYTQGRGAEMMNSAIGYFGLNREQAQQYFGSLAG